MAGWCLRLLTTGGSVDVTLYGNVNYEHSFEGEAYAWEGKVGLKVTWRGAGLD